MKLSEAYTLAHQTLQAYVDAKGGSRAFVSGAQANMQAAQLVTEYESVFAEHAFSIVLELPVVMTHDDTLGDAHVLPTLHGWLVENPTLSRPAGELVLPPAVLVEWEEIMGHILASGLEHQDAETTGQNVFSLAAKAGEFRAAIHNRLFHDFHFRILARVSAQKA